MKTSIDTRLYAIYLRTTKTQFIHIMTLYRWFAHRSEINELENQYGFENPSWVELSLSYATKAVLSTSDKATAISSLKALEDAGIIIMRSVGLMGFANAKHPVNKHGTRYEFVPASTTIEVEMDEMDDKEWMAYRGSRDTFGYNSVSVDVDKLIKCINVKGEGLYAKESRNNGLADYERAKILADVRLLKGCNENGYPYTSKFNRVYHALQRLPNELRLVSIRINDENVGSIDIKSAMLTALNCLMEDEGERRLMNEYRKEDVYRVIAEWIINNKAVVEGMNINGKYRTALDRIYETKDRESVKSLVCQYCFGWRKKSKAILDTFFSAVFPVAHAMVLAWRNKGKRAWSCEKLWKIESIIWSPIKTDTCNIFDELLVPVSKLNDVVLSVKKSFANKYNGIDLYLHVDSGEEIRLTFDKKTL